MRTGAQIRHDFIEFFQDRGHTAVPSASLVPGNDPTLLFTNSGMVQFKDVFLGADTRPYVRAVDSQKCMRVAGKHNDLDDVGRDDTHHTFFEMLGNWSFGDYYKAEAIDWAWKLLTDVWGLPPERLCATVFRDDLGEIEADEPAADGWRSQPGFDPAHLFYCGRKDNFWEMADTGPCGPCSEIHIDLQPGSGPVTQATLDTPRFVELWNLVFIQYNRHGKAQLDPLPAAHVDTGMGLERMTAILQQTDSNYRTDLLWPLIDAAQRLAGHTDDMREGSFTPYRVIADHARAAAFLIADGVTPGNTGRNYVCRMIIRRAARFGAEIGLTKPFLADIADTVIKTYASAYPELALHHDAVANTLSNEEIRFQRTIDTGLAHLASLTSAARADGRNMLTGPETFNLYATFGLPLEISRDEARKDGLEVDQPGFKQALDSHRLASGAGQFVGEVSTAGADGFRKLKQQLQSDNLIGPDGIEHNPYGPTGVVEPLLALISPNGEKITRAGAGDRIGLIIASTPFYVESGGQVGDTGSITATDRSWKVMVTEIAHPAAGLLVHFGNVTDGSPREGDRAIAAIDDRRRRDAMRNHTATHLLHRELRNLVGEHARQAGSLVAPERLRFDFTHEAALTRTDLIHLAHAINQAILANHPVIITHEHHDEALARGATALFGEKYGEIVRTVQIGAADTIYSLELCGGTHVTHTADVGHFIITSEGSVAAGTRRIEALTGRAALEHIENSLDVLADVSAKLRVDVHDLPAKIDDLLNAQIVAERAHADSDLNIARSRFREALAGVTEVLGVPILAARVDVPDAALLRKMTDWYGHSYPAGVIVIGAQIESRVSLVVRVSKDLLDRGLRADHLVASLSKRVGGRGGGKPTLAQGGGKHPERLDAALAEVEGMVSKALAEPK